MPFGRGRIVKIELELGDGSTSVKEPKLCKIPMLAMVQPDFNSDSVKISVGLDIIIFVGLEIVYTCTCHGAVGIPPINL